MLTKLGLVRRYQPSILEIFFSIIEMLTYLFLAFALLDDDLPTIFKYIAGAYLVMAFFGIAPTPVTHWFFMRKRYPAEEFWSAYRQDILYQTVSVILIAGLFGLLIYWVVI